MLTRITCKDIINLSYYMQDEDRFCGEAIFEVVSKVDSHSGGVDFYLHSLGWILTHFWENSLITQEVKQNRNYTPGHYDYR